MARRAARARSQGLGWHLPSPIQTHDAVNVAAVRETKIGDGVGTSTRGARVVRPAVSESLMLTGDENIIDIDVTIFWQVSNAAAYLYNLRDPNGTVKIAAESALREVIAQSSLEDALTTAKAQIQNDVESILQSILDGYEAGVSINEVQLQRVLPPLEVQDAF